MPIPLAMRSDGLTAAAGECEVCGETAGHEPGGCEHAPKALEMQEILDEIGLRRARLAKAVIEAMPASNEGLEALLTGLYHRNPTRLAHTRRVADFAQGIAHELGMPALARQHLARAAWLHDLGKLAIPSTLLNKRGPLTPEELAIVRTHSTIGSDLIRGVPFLHHAAAVVAATHERWAGDGHPAGLAGDAIPLAARIVAVADAFDALAGAPGKRTLDARDQANAELVRHAGSHFDPTVVCAWLRASETVGC